VKATEQLVNEHKAISGALDVLGAMGERIEMGKRPDVNDLGRIIDFLKGFADGCHHAKEELHLFPAMERAGVPREQGPIGVMLAEHVLGRKYIRGMAESLEGLRQGAGAAAGEFVSNARGYCNLLRAHIEKENTILFPMADHRLTPETQQALVSAFAMLEEREIGPGVHEQYHAMLDELRVKYPAS